MLPRITAFDSQEHHEFTLSGDNGATALLIHGFPGTPDEMRPLAAALNAAGWTAHAVLLPGFGPDINTLPERTCTDWMQAVERALTTLRRDHDTVLLVGHSMGGALAIAAAAQQSVNGLVTLAPFYKLNHMLWSALPVLKITFPTIKPFRTFKLDFSNPEVRDGILRYMPDLDLDDPATQEALKDFTLPLKMFDQIRQAGLNAYRLAPAVRVPTLVIQGMRDTLVTPANTRLLTARMTQSVRWVEVDAEHDLIRADRHAWPMVEAATLDFAAQFVKVKTP